MHIIELKSASTIAESFNVFLELRPHLQDDQSFVYQVLEQIKEGYKLFAIYEQEIVSLIGFRVMTTLVWGKVLYIDDLITKESKRGNGYAKALIDFAKCYALDNNCTSLHLDSGYARHDAHKLYLNYGFKLCCHHFILNI